MARGPSRLGTLEIANEKLSNLNSLSEENYQRMSQEFRQNTRTLAEVKRELDSVFRRIRCEHQEHCLTIKGNSHLYHDCHFSLEGL